LLNSVSGWSDERVASYIERTFGIDIPGYKMGTSFVPRTGLAMVHQGEEIIPADQNRQGGGISINNYIKPGPGMDESELADKVARATEKTVRGIFERV
jgi:hypothetical protein